MYMATGDLLCAPSQTQKSAGYKMWDDGGESACRGTMPSPQKLPDHGWVSGFEQGTAGAEISTACPYTFNGAPICGK